MSDPSRLVTPERRADDIGDTSLRPQLLADFVGQAQARANLQVFIDAARKRKEALDHVLFVGPPGLGKTTLAQIVARELGVGFRATSGPAAVVKLSGALDDARAPRAVADAISELVNLGYGQPQPAAAIAAASREAGEKAETAQLIRLGLKELSR